MAEENKSPQPNFESFLNWASTKIQGQPSAGDMLSRLSELWNEWQAENEFARRFYEKLHNNVGGQRKFLECLGSLPGFADGRDQLAPYQLVRCDGFNRWTSLQPYTRLADEYRKEGVYVGLVKHLFGQDGSVTSFKKLVVVLIPRTNHPPSTEMRVWPVNFAADSATREALGLSGEAMLSLLRSWSGAGLLWRLLIGSPSIRYAGQMFGVWRRLCRTLLQSDCYVLIDIGAGEETDGGSAGLSCALALLLAAVKVCRADGEAASSDAYAKFISLFLPRLDASRVTGAIRDNGSVVKVDGLSEKLEAMREQYAILPQKNLTELGVTSVVLQKKYKLKGLCSASSLGQVLRWLMDWPSRYALRNGVLVVSLAVMLGLGIWFDVPDRYFRPPPALQSVEIRKDPPQRFGLAYVLKEDIEIRNKERIALQLEHPRTDGRTLVHVRAEPRQGQGMQFECLQVPTEIIDLHPEVMLSVQDGKAVFDYVYQKNPCPGDQKQEGQIARESLTVTIWRNGRIVQKYPLTLLVR